MHVKLGCIILQSPSSLGEIACMKCDHLPVAQDVVSVKIDHVTLRLVLRPLSFPFPRFECTIAIASYRVNKIIHKVNISVPQ